MLHAEAPYMYLFFGTVDVTLVIGDIRPRQSPADPQGTECIRQCPTIRRCWLNG